MDLALAKLIMCLSLQKGWTSKHLDFQNAFPNGHLDRPIYAEFLRHIFLNSERIKKVLKLERSLYGLRDAAKVRNHLLLESSRQLGSKDLHAVPCIFHKKSMIIMCYVDVLLFYAKNTNDI